MIIDAIYQDVIRGRLDQLHRMFEVEWAMGRDLSDNELPHILEALQLWSRSTHNVLETLDRKISKVKEEERAHAKMLEDHDKAFNDNLKEVYAKSKEQQTNSNTGARRTRQMIGSGGGRDDGMELDEPSDHRGRDGAGGLLGALRGKKKYAIAILESKDQCSYSGQKFCG